MQLRLIFVIATAAGVATVAEGGVVERGRGLATGTGCKLPPKSKLK